MFIKILIQCLLDKNYSNFITNLIYKKNLLYQISDVFSYNYDNNSIIYINILLKQYCLTQLWYPIFAYNYSILASEKTLHAVCKKYNNNFINSTNICKLIPQHFIFAHLKIGEISSYLVLSKKKIKCLIYSIFSQKIYIYHDVDTTLTKGIIKVLKKSNDELFCTVLFIGELNKTFIDSARNLGLQEQCILDIVNALQYQLDFRKLRQGDRFAVLVSSYKVNGNNKIQNKLIGARLNSSGKDYYVFRAHNGKLYNQEAVRLGSDFIRLPLLQPYRISSNFNLNRVNPVTGLISPHAGVDFAVPIGTPVLSVGDGEVIISKYSKIAGNYVGIRHNYQCMTRYMHLKKVLVKPGQKVKQGQQIALSGNTGRSTGPHLHFEVWINHHPVNPLTANILNSDKLLGIDRIKYLNQINEIVPKLKFD